MKHKYSVATVGGTFDRFHRGHEALIDNAFAHADKVIIGIATAKLYQHKLHTELIESYPLRKAYITSYLKNHGYTHRAEIIPIDDLFGTTLEDISIEAIIVTESNLPNVRKINIERKLHALPALHVVEVPEVKAEDGEIISSVRIRNGEIDRNGTVYGLLFSDKTKYILPQSLREELRIPGGNVFDDMAEVITGYGNKLVIAVGDIVSLSLFNNQRQAEISIFDLKSRRKTLTSQDMSILKSLSHKHAAENQHGTIEKQAVEVLKTCLHDFVMSSKKQAFFISGEEDLLVIPAVLLSPLESVVVYGQYDKGVVVVEVTEDKKKEMIELLKKFV